MGYRLIIFPKNGSEVQATLRSKFDRKNMAAVLCSLYLFTLTQSQCIEILYFGISFDVFMYECILQAPQGKFVRLTIDDLELPTSSSSCYHFLEVQYNLIGQTGIR